MALAPSAPPPLLASLASLSNAPPDDELLRLGARSSAAGGATIEYAAADDDAAAAESDDADGERNVDARTRGTLDDAIVALAVGRALTRPVDVAFNNEEEEEAAAPEVDEYDDVDSERVDSLGAAKAANFFSSDAARASAISTRLSSAQMASRTCWLGSMSTGAPC